MEKRRPPSFSPEYLRSILHYDPDTGRWTWRVRKSNCVRVGQETGSLDTHGYKQLNISGRMYLAARMAFYYMLGEWPPAHVDHIDMVRNNDVWSNLRLATRSQNYGNQRAYRTNKSGLKGVSVNRKNGKYVAQIQKDGKKIHIGYYDEPTQAHEAYKAAALKYFGEFARAA